MSSNITHEIDIVTVPHSKIENVAAATAEARDLSDSAREKVAAGIYE